MYTQTAERLANYFDFDPQIIDQIATVAEEQSRDASYGAFFERIGMPAVQNFTARFGEAPLQVLDYQPEGHDPDHALVLSLPHGNPLDDNQRYQVGTVIAANPKTRVVVAGNPSGGKWDSGRLDYDARKELSRSHNPTNRPSAVALDRYLSRAKVHHADHAGESEGTRRAAALARYGQRAVGNIILIEPLIGPRSFIKLGRQFLKTNKALHTYTRAPGLEQFTAARKADSIKGMAYFRGLLDPSNVASTRALTRGDVMDDVGAVLIEDEHTMAHVYWGSLSEFDTETKAPDVIAGLFFRTGGRIEANSLPGQKHALINDIHLKTAVINQALATAA